jgi:hypothetical protein
MVFIIEVIVNMNRKSMKLRQFVIIFQNLFMFSIRLGARVVGA